MWQTLFEIPLPGGRSLPVYGYGLMMVVGFLLAIELAKFLARRVGLKPDLFVNAGLIALVSGVIGARLSHVLENLPEYTDPSRSLWANFIDAVNISSGGLTYYGGVLFAAPCVIAYTLKKRIPLRIGMDIIAPCLMVGLAFGRVGCFLNGCCYGAQCESPVSVRYPYASPPYADDRVAGAIVTPEALLLRIPDYHPRLLKPDELRDMQALNARIESEGPGQARASLQARGGPFNNPLYTEAYLSHADRFGGQDLIALAREQRSAPHLNAQLLSTVTGLLIAALLVAYFTLPHAPGRGLALMLMLEGATRFLLEMLRVEPPVTHLFGYPFSFSMLLSLLFIPTGALLWYVFGRFAPRQHALLPAPPTPPAPPAPTPA